MTISDTLRAGDHAYVMQRDCNRLDPPIGARVRVAEEDGPTFVMIDLSDGDTWPMPRGYLAREPRFVPRQASLVRIGEARP